MSPLPRGVPVTLFYASRLTHTLVPRPYRPNRLTCVGLTAKRRVAASSAPVRLSQARVPTSTSTTDGIETAATETQLKYLVPVSPCGAQVSTDGRGWL